MKVMEWFRPKGMFKVQVEEHPVKKKTPSTHPPRTVPLNASTSTINEMTSPPVNVHVPTANPDSSTPRSTVSTAPGYPKI